jgi:hypothetical protein
VFRALTGRPSTICYRVLVTGEPVPREFADQLVDRFLARISPAPPPVA